MTQQTTNTLSNDHDATPGFSPAIASPVIECLLFAAAEPLTIEDLAKASQFVMEDVVQALSHLQMRLTRDGSGLQVLQIAGGWQLSTRPEHAEAIGRLLSRGTSRLSRAALETLAIIAYRQPVTSPEIEAVRGVSSDGVLKTLLDRRLIAEAGRKAAIGRPMLYKTTEDFLHYFGIADLSQLPELDLEAPPPVPAEHITDGRAPVLPVSTPETEPDSGDGSEVLASDQSVEDDVDQVN